MLSPKRDLTAAKLFLRLALAGPGRIRQRVINVDGHPAYARAIAELKQSGELGRRCRCRPTPYLNNVIEQDHRFIKKRIAASLWFRSVEGALRTIAGYEAMHLIRKGQIRWLQKGRCGGAVQVYPQPLRHRFVNHAEYQKHLIVVGRICNRSHTTSWAVVRRSPPQQPHRHQLRCRFQVEPSFAIRAFGQWNIWLAFTPCWRAR
jgi:hypothetical protein